MKIPKSLIYLIVNFLMVALNYYNMIHMSFLEIILFSAIISVAIISLLL